MKNVLISTGGNVNYEWAEKWLENKVFDYVVAADSGLMHCEKLKIKVDYIVGDYDSVNCEVLQKYKNTTETKTYPAEKDYTDTHIALLKAIALKPEKIYIIGATGSRYDHAFTNICIMKQALLKNISCEIYDEKNKIYLANKNFKIDINMQYGKYLSFVPMTENVEISLTGVKYPLENYKLEQGLSICQSNEISERYADISIHSGVVIVFETVD